jgi:hypothetical protein
MKKVNFIVYCVLSLFITNSFVFPMDQAGGGAGTFVGAVDMEDSCGVSDDVFFRTKVFFLRGMAAISKLQSRLGEERDFINEDNVDSLGAYLRDIVEFAHECYDLAYSAVKNVDEIYDDITSRFDLSGTDCAQVERKAIFVVRVDGFNKAKRTIGRCIRLLSQLKCGLLSKVAISKKPIELVTIAGELKELTEKLFEEVVSILDLVKDRLVKESSDEDAAVKSVIDALNALKFDKREE